MNPMVDQVIAESEEYLDAFVEMHQKLATEFGREQAVCDMAAYLLARDNIDVDSISWLAVAIGRLGRLERREDAQGLFRATLITALGLVPSASDFDIVDAAAGAWRIAQGVAEGTLVDDGPTELEVDRA